MEIEKIYEKFQECSGVSTDTRKININSLFFALKGDNFDANKFALEAIIKGAKYVVIDNASFKIEGKTIIVEDTLKCLQALAKYHRKQLKTILIGLTGSNGKTTTKELINAVLSSKFKTIATIGNLNNHIGVPLTLLRLKPETEIGIIEMGANHQKEIAFLCNITEPDYGYITNFGKAHLEGFGGIEGIIEGKSELYYNLETENKSAFVNLDDTLQKEKTKNIKRITFSQQEEIANVFISKVETNPMVSVTFNNVKIQSNLIGAYNATNINASICIGKHFNIDEIAIKKAIEAYIPDNNRSQLVEKNSNELILDAYNANPSSMQAAIENFTKISKENKIAILGDMFELGKESLAEHKIIVDQLKQLEKIETYFIGKDFYQNKVKSPHLYFYENFEEFSEYIKNKNIRNSFILIKGSRGMALERTLEILN
jgi:UDP-N-acetylmuramoyl-tripeptide--D-alanyl-D-alanine ligase